MSSDIGILRNVFILQRVNKAKMLFSSMDELQLEATGGENYQQPRK